MLKKNIILLFLCFFSFNYLFAANIEQEDFDQLLSKLENNLNTYEITTQTALLNKNDQIIVEFSDLFKVLNKEIKLNFIRNSLNNLNDNKANLILKIISKDFENQSNLKNLTSSEQFQFNELLSFIIDTSYQSEKKYNDSGYEIAKIILNSDIKTANDLLSIISSISSKNNNSKNLASNVLYNLNKNSINKFDLLSSDFKNELIRQSLKELTNDIILNKPKINNKIQISDNFNRSPLDNLSISLLSKNIDLSENITDNILDLDETHKEELISKLIEQTNLLDAWQDNETEEIINTKNIFVDKIYPEFFKNVNLEKMLVAEKVILNSNIDISSKTIEAVVDSYLENNNNFFKVDNNFLKRLQNIIDASKINNNIFIKSKYEAEIILKSFYLDPIPAVILTNPQLAYAYSALPLSSFDSLVNVSPN